MAGHTLSHSRMWVSMFPGSGDIFLSLLCLISDMRLQGRYTWLPEGERWVRHRHWHPLHLVFFPTPRFCWLKQWQVLRGSLCICESPVKGEGVRGLLPPRLGREVRERGQVGTSVACAQPCWGAGLIPLGWWCSDILGVCPQKKFEKLSLTHF